MTKLDLMGALNNLLNNFIFGMALTRLVPDAAWNEVANGHATFQGSGGDLLHVDMASLVRGLSNATDRKIIVDGFESGLKRALVREGHEVIQCYCEETDQFPQYKAEPWFQFARIIRNTVSHKDAGTLREWPRDLGRAGITAVHWRSRTLDTSFIGNPVEFTHHEALLLFHDQCEFAKTKLT